MESIFWITLVVLVVLALGLAPRHGLVARWRRWESARRRTRLEDALKHLLTLSERGQPGSAESLAGALGLNQKQIIRLIARMEARGMLHSTSGGFQLTRDGEKVALQIVRAHRLWERYLADEAGLPLSKLHQEAEKAEHRMSAERLDVLEAHLGHPLTDPHGDPIPRADGSMVKVGSVPLTDWPAEQKARIVHLEDEPDVVLQQILALGLRPGSHIRVVDSQPEYLLVSDGGEEHRLAPVIAANIHVVAAPRLPERPAGLVPLSALNDGEEADVVNIDAECRGFGRRRLLDLGLTPASKVRAELATAFGDPRAYRVRGAVIAIRQEQARHIWVRRSSDQGVLTT